MKELLQQILISILALLLILTPPTLYLFGF